MPLGTRASRSQGPKAGVTLEVGRIEALFVAPVGSGYKSLNDYSAVLRLTYGETSFLFAGDAERVSEAKMLATERVLSADVLKVGHHGSNTSSTAAFLRSVDPTYAVIPVGSDNDYDHPHNAVLERLAAQSIIVLRTDELGTIAFSSDGHTLQLEYQGLVEIGTEQVELALGMEGVSSRLAA